MCSWNPADFVKFGDFYDIDDDENIHRAIKGKQFKAVNHNLRATYNAVDSVAEYIKKNKQTVNDVIVDYLKAYNLLGLVAHHAIHLVNASTCY